MKISIIYEQGCAQCDSCGLKDQWGVKFKRSKERATHTEESIHICGQCLIELSLAAKNSFDMKKMLRGWLGITDFTRGIKR